MSWVPCMMILVHQALISCAFPAPGCTGPGIWTGASLSNLILQIQTNNLCTIQSTVILQKILQSYQQV